MAHRIIPTSHRPNPPQSGPRLVALASGLLCLGWSQLLLAQDAEPEPATESPEPPAAETAPAEPEATAPEPAAPPEGASATAVEAPPEAAAPEEPTPPTGEEKPFEPSFTVGAGLRTGFSFGLNEPATNQLTLNDGLVDQVHVRPYMGGSLTPNVGYWVQFEVGTPNGLGSFALLDGIAQIKFIEEIQLWFGQHIPANDRNNMNGPFFGNTWNFAIAVEEYPFDVGARDRGATLWGLVGGGHLKYHLSVVDLQPGRQLGKARYAARVTGHILEPENFYYNSGTYFGKQDVLAIGAVVQSQKGDEGTDSDLLGFSFDAMFEKNFGSAGTFTLEGGYWNYEETGPNYVVNQGTIDEGIGIAGPYPGTAYLGVVSWLTPENVGVGKLQPNFRVQYADWAPETRLVIDAGIAYEIDGFNHKYHINYRHQETDPAADGEANVSSDSIQAGVQFLMSN